MGLFHLGDMTITSSAFEHNARIPDRHTCNGDDVSPPLSWSDAPEGTRSFALVCHDPDAPLTRGYTHWVIYGIPADAEGLAEESGSAHIGGVNDFGREGYGGPAPPPGHGVHSYYFHLYALDTDSGLSPGLTNQQLLAEIDEHIICQARIVGTYDR